MEHLDELISCKLKLAEIEDERIQFIEKIRKKEGYNRPLREKKRELEQENKALKDSICQLKSEKSRLRSLLEERAGILSEPVNIDSNEAPQIELPITEDSQVSWEDWERHKDRKLQEMARKGIPKDRRAEVWGKKIGNALYLNQNLFNRLLNKASTLGKEAKENNGIFIIPLDLMRTLGKLKLFQKEQPLHQGLQSVLEAFAAYRPDMGYVQGMGYVGAMLLMHFNTYKSFECMANMILGSELLRTFYSIDLRAMGHYYKTFEFFMSKKVPGVLKLFKNNSITPDIYLLEWVYTLFVRCFHMNVVSRIWDCFMFQGDTFIFRVGIAILMYLRPKLTEDVIDITSILTNLTDSDISSDTIFNLVDKIQITDKKFKEILLQQSAKSDS